MENEQAGQNLAPDSVQNPSSGEPSAPSLNASSLDATKRQGSRSTSKRRSPSHGPIGSQEIHTKDIPSHETAHQDKCGRSKLDESRATVHTTEHAAEKPRVDSETRRAQAQAQTRKLPSGIAGQRNYRFTLYETNARYWITGTDLTDKVFRLLRIDRTSAAGQVALFEDETTYDRREMNSVLTSIDEGNKSTGGLRMKCNFLGLLGFIRFTDTYYMLIVTKRQQVAMIGGHYIYRVEDTELIPLASPSGNRFTSTRSAEESRYLGILNQVDLNKSFYFSYSYDITHSLQHNIIRQRQAMQNGQHQADVDFNSMFVWNHHLLKPAIKALRNPFHWCLPTIHGFIDQAALDIFGRVVYICIIGRRSRHFAGARFLKRGINDTGYVANDVETEQIVSETLTTSFHAPGPRLYSSPNYTSYLHHRGSIPLYWTQDNSGVSPKPGIDLNLQDPFFQQAALHFDNLFERYGHPVFALNLIKVRERTARESKLLAEYLKCIEYLNQSLPKDRKIEYRAFDMSRASKTRDGDVIGSLEEIANTVVDSTGFFRNGDEGFDEPQVQNGVARTNCVDCLDRTNAAQFVIGKRVFALQLQALGVIACSEVDFDTDAVNIFTHMFHDHGDTIAVQYGGSHLVNTMATYRKVNQWQSSSRDMVESFKRYYHNSFLDSQRQEAYNLFLGNYTWTPGQAMLWDLPTDHHLHQSDPKKWLQRQRRSYVTWYTAEFLEPKVMPSKPPTMGDVGEYDDYWIECYKPHVLSSLGKLFSYRMSSTNRHLPERPHRDSRYDYSPFVTRQDPSRQDPSRTVLESPDKSMRRKGVKIMEPDETKIAAQDFAHFDARSRPMIAGEDESSTPRGPTSGAMVRSHKPQSVTVAKPADKAQMHLWTLNEIYRESLNPSVSEQELLEYERYVTHPLKLPLVVSTEIPSNANFDYIDYIRRAGANSFREEEIDEGDRREEDLKDFLDFLAANEREKPLTVLEEDGGKKRYKVYRKWLRGKSLFKQNKVDPEYNIGT